MYDYMAMLNNANATYQATVSGYQGALASLQAGQSNVMQGYNNLQASVLGKLEGQGEYDSGQIARYYTNLSGKNAMQMIDRGLSNTTVGININRGIAADENTQQTLNREKFAALAAGSEERLGLAGLGYSGQALQQQSQLQQAQLGYMGQFSGQQLQAGVGLAGVDAQYRAATARNQQNSGGALGPPTGSGVGNIQSSRLPTSPSGYSGGGGGYSGGGGGGYGAGVNYANEVNQGYQRNLDAARFSLEVDRAYGRPGYGVNYGAPYYGGYDSGGYDSGGGGDWGYDSGDWGGDYGSDWYGDW